MVLVHIALLLPDIGASSTFDSNIILNLYKHGVLDYTLYFTLFHMIWILGVHNLEVIDMFCFLYYGIGYSFEE